MKNLKYSMSTSGEMSIEKTEEEGRKLIQNKRVSSQNKMCEDGATVAASHLPSAQLAVSSSLVRPDRQRSTTMSQQWERVINYRKCPTNETKRRRFSDI
jgi:hypothetical protein